VCGRYATGVGDDPEEASMFLLHNHEKHTFTGDISQEEVKEKPSPIVEREELVPYSPSQGKRKKR
jgi:hypothetical protein